MQLIDQNHEGGDNADAKLEEFLASKFLKTTTLPLGILGSGNADLGAKYECLFHCLKLDVGAVGVAVATCKLTDRKRNRCRCR